MKYLWRYGYGLSILFCCNCVFSQSFKDNQVRPSDTVKGNAITIMTSPELTNLTAEWISGYEKLNPGVKFSVNTISGSRINQAGTISFLSADCSTSPSNWKIIIGRNVIVPVVNAKNPMLKEIAGQGISASQFASIYSNSGKISWADLIAGGQNTRVNQYIIDNPDVKSCVSDFIQKDTTTLNAYLVANVADFTAAIQKDPYAIGFCRLSDIRSAGLNGLDENIRIVPVDRNGNGRIDHFESIYNSPDEFARGVWIGKYPHALSAKIYAMSQASPTDKNAIAFMTWIITDGGKYLVSNGYSDLIRLEKQANLANLSGNTGNEVKVASHTSLLWLFTLVFVFVAILIVMAFTWIFDHAESGITEEAFNPVPALNEIAVSSPEGLYYDKTHTWAFMEKDGMVRLGIDDFLQHITGTITQIKMKEAGEFVRRGEKILTLVKFGKQLTLYSPVSGTIKVLNLKLHENSSLVNTSPFNEGWIYLVEPKNWLRELQFMWMGEKYRDWLKDEFIRLRDFFESSFKANRTSFEYLVLQDGGELRDKLLAEMGPEVWEEFQRNFIDQSR